MLKGKIIVLGAYGYLGWPTCVHLASQGYQVLAVDNYLKLELENRNGTPPLVKIPKLPERTARYHEQFEILYREGDICKPEFTDSLIKEFQPDAVVHYAEIRSAPFSMQNQAQCVETQVNNITGTLNLVWSIRNHKPDCSLVKLGTLGEYGTPDIEIEEGYLEVEHKGRKDTLPYPMQPGSFYHASKVADSVNLRLAARLWGLAITDLNQGVVYGQKVDGMLLGDESHFAYDGTWGTALNRFCLQAAVGEPITVYGKGGQTRGFLNIQDTVRCIQLAIENPPKTGELFVMNQFTEQFSVGDLAERVAIVSDRMGLNPRKETVPNPRIEKESHFYQAAHSKLEDLGLKPTLLTDKFLTDLISWCRDNKNTCIKSNLRSDIKWG